MPMLFDSGAPIQKYRCSLPHWSQDDNANFITFPLFDSLPASHSAGSQIHGHAGSMQQVGLYGGFTGQCLLTLARDRGR